MRMNDNTNTTTNEATKSVANPPHRHLTPEEIKKGCVEIGGDEHGVRICRMHEELEQGMTEMEMYDRSVTFYGSARFKEGDEYYDRARTLGSRVAKELGFTVITGGGPGIMEAGNRGAFEAGGNSVGASIQLPMEQHDNPYMTDTIPFYFFFARRYALSYSSEAFVFFPGGFGTLDELFETLTLLQTGKTRNITVVLIGQAYWERLINWSMLAEEGLIGPHDLALFHFAETAQQAWDLISRNHGGPTPR